jgi:hypothetical protein
LFRPEFVLFVGDESKLRSTNTVGLKSCKHSVHGRSNIGYLAIIFYADSPQVRYAEFMNCSVSRKKNGKVVVCGNKNAKNLSMRFNNSVTFTF